MELNDLNIKEMLLNHENDGGNLINASLAKLFDCLNDESSRFEVSIKVAALNQIYSTAIQYINPIVEKIVSDVPSNHKSLSDKDYIDLVDKISTVNWISPTTQKHHTRCNLSFSSKYVHF